MGRDGTAQSWVVQTYEFGDARFSGVILCFAAPSLSTTGALGDVVRGVTLADPRSAGTGVRLEGARFWKEVSELDSATANGAAIAVDMAMGQCVAVAAIWNCS